MPPSFRDRFRRRPPPASATASAADGCANNLLGGQAAPRPSFLGRRSASNGNGSSSGSFSSSSRRGGQGGGRRGSQHQKPRRPPLATFDACIEACDALAASPSSPQQQQQQQQQQDENGGEANNPPSGSEAEAATTATPEAEGRGKGSKGETNANAGLRLPDCSVLVSPDGALLFTSRIANLSASNDASSSSGDDGSDTSSSRYPWTQIPSVDRDSAILEEEYEAAVVCGNDLFARGDHDANGFSARGWNHDAATSALASSRDVLHAMTGFVEDVAALQKENGLRMNDAAAGRLGQLRRGMAGKRGTGPIMGNNTQMARAMETLEHYYTMEAEGSLERWTMACAEGRRGIKVKELRDARFSRQSNNAVELKDLSTPKTAENDSRSRKQQQSQSTDRSQLIHGLLPKLRSASQKATMRTSERERALHDIRTKVAKAQSTLTKQKEWASKCWQRVAEEEINIDRLYAIKKMEHHEQYEEWRQEQEGMALASSHSEDGKVVEEGPLSDEVWEMVNGLSNMESFGHTGYSPTTKSKAKINLGDDVHMAKIPPPPPTQNAMAHDHVQHLQEPTPPPRMITRADVERESDIHDMRAVAHAADESVEDAAGKLLNVFSVGDTALRSARVAAESCLLSECNAARGCLRSLVAMERAALEEKVARLEALEEAVDAIDVRKDIDHYITEDKAMPGGRSRAGEEDDGGVAAALAVLNSHGEVEGWAESRRGHRNIERPDHFEGWGAGDDDGCYDDDDDDDIEPELFTEVIGMLFSEDNAAGSGEGAGKAPDMQEQISQAAKALAEKTGRGQSHRKAVLYELNNQRSKKTQVEARNFDALCQLFNSFLSGCGREPVDVSNAKMLMILSQTFYRVDDEDKANGSVGDATLDAKGGSTKGRKDRIYVKSRISHNDIWFDDDFWDQAVYQCVSESLAKSGVLLNYIGAEAVGDGYGVSWHDLPPGEYAGAAAQVHSVVFAQLGTLSHSMIELGCGVPRAVSFVRRLSIRYQLPLSLRITLIQHLTKKR